ncbi:hypothetical protein [Bacillus cereus]|uniref:hypothetical protein n=1 Tax=Bacillus cereus TaxID=1396 RepID=UPI000BF3C558|nr:hypothetical protein [Bacillus cereus]PFU27691.1 hypothetical protein COK76_06175 [Bacillus cereus]
MTKLKNDLDLNDNHNEMNDVTGSFESLMESLEAYQGYIGKKVSEHASNKEWQSVTELSNQGEKVDLFIKKVHELKNEWTNLIFDEEEQLDSDGANREEISATARTSWAITDGKIRIETVRIEGTPYSNVVPLALFKDIVFCALNHVEKHKYVKTTNVLNDMGNEIMSKSEYKRAPRIPIYATFKVLMKENLFKNDEGNSHKYLLAGSREQLINWVDSLK